MIRCSVIAPPAPPADRSAHARAEWLRLRAWLSTISPQDVGRSILALSVGGFALWLAIATWPALLPFFIGAALAYAVLPLVNAMDTVLPRFLASLIAMVMVLAGSWPSS